MRSSKWLTSARAAALAVALLAFAPAAFAQPNSNGGSGGTTAARNDRDDDTDYGWIGLLGLAGLLGRKRDTHDRDRDDRR
ncbi:MAG TPA: WGxxGxxG family protein [Pyrinomonadaceae bacterium]